MLAGWEVDINELGWPAGLLIAALLVFTIARGVHIHVHRYDEKSDQDD